MTSTQQQGYGTVARILYWTVALLVVLQIPAGPRLARVMLVVHQFAAVALVGLVVVHVSAVLRHHLIEGNPVVARMWPPVRGGGVSGVATGKDRPTRDASSAVAG